MLDHDWPYKLINGAVIVGLVHTHLASLKRQLATWQRGEESRYTIFSITSQSDVRPKQFMSKVVTSFLRVLSLLRSEWAKIALLKWVSRVEPQGAETYGW